MGDARITSTPYDDVFHTLLNEYSSLIIPMINEIFGENYTGNERIIFSPNEHFLNQQDGNQEERITDTSFVIKGKEEKKYHNGRLRRSRQDIGTSMCPGTDSGRISIAILITTDNFRTPFPGWKTASICSAIPISSGAINPGTA